MADEPRAEAAGHLPAFDFQAGAGIFYFRLRIGSSWLVAGLFGGSTLALGAFYILHREAVDAAVKIALAGLADRVLKIRPSSVLVEFVCYTKERFLAFMDAFATGTVKQRLQEELSQIGFKDKLEVTVTVYDIESEMRKEEEWRISGFELPPYFAFSTAHSMESGPPTEGELFELGYDIEDRWRRLGHCLGVSEEVLDIIDQQEGPLVSMKGYRMLSYWKRAATAYYMYNVLDGALRHEDVQRQDLAEKFCQGEHKMELHPSGLNILSEKLMKAAPAFPRPVKVGTPTNDELEELAYAIMGGWRKLGRRLDVSEAELNSIDQNFQILWKKGYHMLIHWKRDADASYKVLDDALRHKDVQRQDLAEKFCHG